MSVHHDRVEEIDALELSALDKLFSNQPLSNDSTKLFIEVFGRIDREVAVAAYKDGLSNLDGKKRLKFYPLTSDTKV
jgi:alpha-N-acetylglucosamine transferase